jgi:uncharacterized protein YjbI with pentapeptide repeats
MKRQLRSNCNNKRNNSPIIKHYALSDEQLIKSIISSINNAKNIYLAILLISTYCGFELFLLSDFQIITDDAFFIVPLLNIKISCLGFIVFAPALLILLFLYSQIYLQYSREYIYVFDSRHQSISAKDISPMVRYLDNQEYQYLADKIIRAIISFALWWIVPLVILLFPIRYIKSHNIPIIYFVGIYPMISIALTLLCRNKYEKSAIQSHSDDVIKSEIKIIRFIRHIKKIGWKLFLLYIGLIFTYMYYVKWIPFALDGYKPNNFLSEMLFLNINKENLKEYLRLENKSPDNFICNFDNKHLEGAVIDGIVLYNPSFANVNFKNSRLLNSKFINADFFSAKLESTLIDNCEFYKSNFAKAVIDSSTISNIININERDFVEVFKNHNKFESCCFIFTKIHNSYFKNTNFNHSLFSGSDINNSHFNNCDFDSTIFYSLTKNPFFQQQDSSKYLNNASILFSGAIIDNVEFYECDMKNLKLNGGLILEGGYPQLGCKTRRLYFDRTKLNGTDFTQADLTGSSFVDSELDDVSFNNSKLLNVKFWTDNISEVIYNSDNSYSYRKDIAPDVIANKKRVMSAQIINTKSFRGAEMDRELQFLINEIKPELLRN